MTSALVRVPTDTLKHRVQAYLHQDIFEAARTICKSSGVRGLYRGFWPTLMRDVPEIAIQFTLYERCAIDTNMLLKQSLPTTHSFIGCVVRCT